MDFLSALSDEFVYNLVFALVMFGAIGLLSEDPME